MAASLQQSVLLFTMVAVVWRSHSFQIGSSHGNPKYELQCQKAFGHVCSANIQIILCICSLVKIFTGLISESPGCKVSSCGLDQHVRSTFSHMVDHK